MNLFRRDRPRNAILGLLIAVPSSLAIWLLIGWLVWVVNCATPTDYRKIGFRDVETGFSMLPPIEAPVVIDLPALRVHLLPPGTVPEVTRGRCARSGVVGCALPTEVWLEGRKTDGGIVINQAVAGHEFQHLLNFACGAVAEPDRKE